MSAVPLKDRANLSIPEAMKLTRLSRRAVEAKLADGRWRWFWEGQRQRIVTISIFEDQERQAQEAMARTAA